MMTPERFNRIEELFHLVRDKPPEERAALLLSACPDDAELREEVLQMLAHAEVTDLGHVRNGVAQAAQASGDSTGEVGALEGAQVGPYRVIRKIGEGRMGIVYEAEQTAPVRRRIALKVVKLGMDTNEFIARFESERQALALMNHPNVARVHDAGATDNGRPYLAMEFVGGLPITEHCDRHKLSIDERLALFEHVCAAIQHAHQKGIIHRDIKPSNILVEYADGKPMPKVIDFGVAKATNQRLTERTLYTQYGQLVGTPEYMSPEQADISVQDIDTRTDVYSLGVLLYELLTGALPFDPESLRKATYEQMQRTIREVEPPRPSTRVSGLSVSQPDATARAADRRRTQLRALSRTLRGDLDWIVMRCLEKDRARRYETPHTLALEVQRYLNNEPVIAGPPSVAYKLRKFVRRNRVVVVASVVSVASLLIGSALAAIGLIADQRATASDNCRMEAALGFVREDVFGSLRFVAPRAIGQPVLTEELGVRRESHVAACGSQAVGTTWRFRPPTAGEPPAATPFAVRHDFCGGLLGKSPDEVTVVEMLDAAAVRIRDRFRTEPQLAAEMSATLGMPYVYLGQYAKAAKLLERSIHLHSSELAPHDPILLELQANLARAYVADNRTADAERIVLPALETSRASHGDEANVTLLLRVTLGMVRIGQWRLDDAERLFSDVLTTARQANAQLTPAFLEGVVGLSGVLLLRQKYQRAIALLEDVYATDVSASDDPWILMVAHNLGSAYSQQGEYEKAEAILADALERFQKVLPDEHPAVLSCQNDLGATLLRVGKNDKAIDALNRVLTYREQQNRTNPSILINLVNLSAAHNNLQEFAEAERIATDGLERRFGFGHKRLSSQKALQLNRGRSRIGLADYARAEEDLRDAHDHFTQASLFRDYALECEEQFVALYEAWEKPEEAAYWRSELERRRATTKPSVPAQNPSE